MGINELTEPHVGDRKQRKAQRDRERLPEREREVIELEPELIRVIEMATD